MEHKNKYKKESRSMAKHVNFVVNKKLWSFNFGCLIAFSFMWLVNIGHLAPVPEMLHPHPLFILDYYSGVVTALSALVLTGVAVVVMWKGLQICTSEHPFWLILPSITFIAFTTISAFEMVTTFLYAAIPALFVVTITALYYRLAKQKLISEKISIQNSLKTFM